MNDVTITDARDVQRFESKWTEEQEKLIKDTICRGATNDELKLFMYVCKKTGLDPFVKQIHSVARWDSKLGCEVRTTQTSVDGYRVIADRTGKYEGQIGPLWCGKDGEWKDVWLEEKPPLAAKVGVLKTGFKEPIWSVANWSSYCPMIRNKKTGEMEVSKFWKTMGPLMLGKVAECLSLRRAFPIDLSGIYSDEEMDYADAEAENDKPLTPITPPIDYKKEAEEKKVALEELKQLCTKATNGLTPKQKAEWMVRVLKVRNFNEIEQMKKEKIFDLGAEIIKTINMGQ